MRLKPKSTTLNPKAALYKRYTAIQRSIIPTTYKTGDGKRWFFDATIADFVYQTTPSSDTVIYVNSETLMYQSGKITKFFAYVGGKWTNPQTAVDPDLVQFGNIAQYQLNTYYRAGNFDFVVRGDIEGTDTQPIRGAIMSLTSLAIKHFNDDIQLAEGDLVVLGGHLYSVENPSVSHKYMPKHYNIYFATLNSIK